MAEKQQKLKIVKLVGRLCVAVIALAFIGAKQNWTELLILLKSLKISVICISTLLFSVGGILIAYRWFLLLKSQKIVISLHSAIKVNFLGMFYNNFLLSSIGGDLLRAWYITKHTSKRLEAAFSVLIDRIIGLITILLMAVVSILFMPGGIKLVDADGKSNIDFSAVINFVKAPLFWGTILSILVIGIASWFLLPKLRNAFYGLLRKVNERRHKLFDAIKLYCKSPFTILFAIFLTFLSQGLTILGMVLVGINLGIDIPVKFYFIFFPIGWLVAAIPISPGGVGVLELGLVALFCLLPEVSREQALSLALCQRLIFILGSLPGIFIHISGMHLPQIKNEFSVDS